MINFWLIHFSKEQNKYRSYVWMCKFSRLGFFIVGKHGGIDISLPTFGGMGSCLFCVRLHAVESLFELGILNSSYGVAMCLSLTRKHVLGLAKSQINSNP